jgi:hypothetical protein
MLTRSALLRSLQAGTASLILVGAIAVPALAAPPPNDDRADATVIAALPFADALDTSEATPQASDPECASGPGNPTVWYSFTPGASGTYGVTTSGSDYDTTLLVGIPTGGGIDVIDCSDDAGGVTSLVVWEAQAGQEYLVMAGACCGSPGGQLELRLRRDPPVPQVRVSIAPGGVTNRFGAALVRGRLECSGAGGASGFVEVTVRQRAGRFIIRGGGGTELRCNSYWRARVQGNIGPFKPGDVSVRALAVACASFGCGDDVGQRTVRLTRPR